VLARSRRSSHARRRNASGAMSWRPRTCVASSASAPPPCCRPSRVFASHAAAPAAGLRPVRRRRPRAVLATSLAPREAVEARSGAPPAFRRARRRTEAARCCSRGASRRWLSLVSGCAIAARRAPRVAPKVAAAATAPVTLLSVLSPRRLVAAMKPHFDQGRFASRELFKQHSKLWTDKFLRKLEKEADERPHARQVHPRFIDLWSSGTIT
jgi:hypothetical protein